MGFISENVADPDELARPAVFHPGISVTLYGFSVYEGLSTSRPGPRL